MSSQTNSDCNNAIPICAGTPTGIPVSGYGNDDFSGAVEVGCFDAPSGGTIETNSVWYRFRAAADGQLGFTIKFDNDDDWDFMLFRANDCSSLGEPIRCNFSDNSENTGYAGVGVNPITGTQTVQYEDWLTVTTGEDYYLMINNFKNSGSQFSIEFTGSVFSTNPTDALDCSIVTDLLGGPKTACKGSTLLLDAATLGATSYAWSYDDGTGFVPLPSTTAVLNIVNNGIDNNDGVYSVVVSHPSGDIFDEVQVGFYDVPVANAVADLVICDDAELDGISDFDLGALDFDIFGMSNEDDFIISYHLTQVDADSGASPLDKMHRNITAYGERIYIRMASAYTNKCVDTSQSFELVVVQSPEVTVTENVFLCSSGAGATIGDVGFGGYEYLWDAGETTATKVITTAGVYKLKISNVVGVTSCSIDITIMVVTSAPPVILPPIITDLAPNNTVEVVLENQGDFVYKLGDSEFQESNIFEDVLGGVYTLIVRDVNGCGDDSEEIVVVGYPKFFTPNGDNNNDYWHIQGREHLNNPVVHIFDRYGMLLKTLREESKGWNGTFNGKLMPSSDYWFRLEYVNIDGVTTTAKYIGSHFSLRR